MVNRELKNNKILCSKVPLSSPAPVFLVPPQVDAPSSDSLVPGQFLAMLRVYELTLDTIERDNKEKKNT